MNPEEKAHYAARVFAESNYRGFDIWIVKTSKTEKTIYGGDSAGKLTRGILDELAGLQESITVSSLREEILFTPDEGYLIARTLEPET